MTGTASAVGGLVGDSIAGSITQSYASVQVTGGKEAGGLVGFAGGGTVQFAYATGSVTGTDQVGGLIGGAADNGNFSDLWASGKVTGTTALQGGLIGNLAGGTITHSFWDTFSTGQANAAAGAGTVDATVLAVTSNPTQSGAANYAFSQSAYTANFSFGVGGSWFMVDGSTRPFLQSEFSTTIDNAHQLQLMAMNLNANYTLGRDIDATATNGANPSDMWTTAGFAPIGALGSLNQFTGSLDGQNHVIDGLFIYRPSTDYVGLFGYARDATIANVGLSRIRLVDQRMAL